MALALDLRNLPDADVAALAKEGREPAFRELVRRYERPVFSLIFRMVRNRELAEALSQHSFTKVLHNIARYRPDSQPSPRLSHNPHHRTHPRGAPITRAAGTESLLTM